MAPAESFPPDLETALDRIMNGAPPLRLFATVGRDPRLLRKMFRGGFLDDGNLTVRQREILIHRVTANCGADYEFGVHALHFAPKAGLDSDALSALAHPVVDQSSWATDESALIRLCDELHSTSRVSDELWALLSEHLTSEAIMESLMVAGFYRMISYLCNGLALPIEDGTSPLPASV